MSWDFNLFHSDPTLLEPSDEASYQRSAHALSALADPRRLKVLHALAVGEDTPQRAAAWAGLPQRDVERELVAMTLAGMVERRDGAHGYAYAPRDGHVVVHLYVALAHGNEQRVERHPRLLARRRPSRSVPAALRAG